MEKKTRSIQTLNTAGLLAKQFIESKLTLLIIITIFLLGGLALVKTPRTYNPEIIVPVINISVSRAGNNPQEMLNQIVRPLEGLMASIPGVDHTYGMAIDDNALVTVRFKVNENEQESLVKVYNQINSNLDKMPPGTNMPLIRSVSLYDVPLLTITLYSDALTTYQLRNIATKLLEDLRAVPQVGKSEVIGASAAAVRVWLNPIALEQHHISVSDIQNALSINNISINVGNVENTQSQKKIALRVEGVFISEKELGSVIIGTDNAKPVLLKDVSRIEAGPETTTVQSFFSFGQASSQPSDRMIPSVTIAIARQKASNGVNVARAVLKRLDLAQQAHQLPETVKYKITRNYGDDADDAVNTLIEHLGIAIISVVLLLILFLGWREASIVMFSIPLILFLVLGIGWITGQTINRITLFALILSLGLLVDDSIVVIENIHRHLLKGVRKNFNELIIYAANEVGKPTVIATFTVMLALLPMAFVSGMMGPFMAPIPFNAPLAMIVSLFIAYSAVPYLAFHWLKRTQDISHIIQENRINKKNSVVFLQKNYSLLLIKMIKSSFIRHLFYCIIIVLLTMVLLQPAWQFIRPSGPNGPLSPLGVEIKMLPDDNVNTLLIALNAGSSATTEKTLEIAKNISQPLSKNPYITNYQIFLGEAAPEDFASMARGDTLQQGSQYAQIRVNLTDKNHRNKGSHTIAKELYPHLKKINLLYPAARIKLFESPPGPPVKSQMEAGIFGPDYAIQRKLATLISTEIYPKIFGMINTDNSVTEDSEELVIEVNHNAATLAGLEPRSITKELEAYFKGTYVGNAHYLDARDPVHIILRLPKSVRDDPHLLNHLFLKNKQNDLIALAQVTRIRLKPQQKPIYTRDQNTVAYVTGEILGSSPAYAVTTATKMIKDTLKLNSSNLGFRDDQPQNINTCQLLWFGEIRLTLDVFRDLGSAFIVAILLIYVLLTAFYQSFFIPLIIMGAIPLTIIGVFPGHWLMHQPFTATSMIGVIALAGIVVRNSLLLIDFILEHQKSGYPVEEAIIESGVERLLPILLTALAIILGSSVMLSDPVFGGLAISLVFGAFASTVLTLFLIPLIYLGWWKRTQGYIRRNI